MNAVIVLIGSAGLALLYSGLIDPAPRSSRRVVRMVGRRYGIPSGRLPLLIAAVVGTALVVAVVAIAITRLSMVGIVAGSAGATIPLALLKRRARRREEALRDAWPDAIGALIAMLRSGTSLPDAVAALADRGPTALRPAFESFRNRYRASPSFVLALEGLGREVDDPVGDKVVVTLQLAYEVGGSDLVRALRTLGDFVRDDLRVRREIAARWSWTVTAARLAAAAPWLVLAMMSSRPEAAAAYSSASGAVVVILGGVATALGYRLMLRAARLPEPRRIGR